MKEHLTFFWFRRDLRLHDNAGLYHALRSGLPVQPVFIFDRNILDALEDRSDRRVVFIHQQLERLQKELKQLGATLLVGFGRPADCWKRWSEEYSIRSVFTNHDYEPYATRRDSELRQFFDERGISFHTFKDQVIFEKSEVMKDDGSPYTVFTPYMKKWRSLIRPFFLKSYPTERYTANFLQRDPLQLPSLKEMGFHEVECAFPESTVSTDLLRDYTDKRDIPGIRGTSRLSVHLRFGTISIRDLVREAWSVSEKWVNELIWREFYQMILWHFPHVTERSFKAQYDLLEWKNDEELFRAWCEGRTGYPIVDAGMRELNATGFMHNRVRMITASFLTKFLLIDWRWGEAYFAAKLLDFELASNNGGWQWSAGTGVDAAPYFRIFNMDEQTRKFDPDFSYIRRWVPEFQELTYPRPIVDYKMARQRCLEFYKVGLEG